MLMDHEGRHDRIYYCYHESAAAAYRNIGQARSEEKKRKEKGGARAPRIFGFSASDTGWMSFYFNF